MGSGIDGLEVVHGPVAARTLGTRRPLAPMQYPFHLTFKILAVAPQIRITDAAGAPVMFVHQKAFKLKEAVTVYRDESRGAVLYTIAADRVLDFNAAYQIHDGTGREVGTLARRGRRSLWRARYDILDAQGRTVFRVHEDNVWAKVGDSILREIPFLALLGGYLFHPSYTVEADDPDTPEREGDPVMRLSKKPAMWEGRFELERLADLETPDEELLVVSLLMMLLRERARG